MVFIIAEIKYRPVNLCSLVSQSDENALVLAKYLACNFANQAI